ncbi:hypothetical protein JW859_14555 [bacterium]|nr:hypothetical protein [bacterium]
MSKKADHNRRQHDDGRSPWELPADFRDPEVPAADLARLKSDFLSATVKARQRLTPAGARPSAYFWQWATAAGMFLLVVAAGIFLVGRNAPAPGPPDPQIVAQAKTAMVIQSALVRTSDGKPIPNVRIVRLDAPQSSETSASANISDLVISPAQAGFGGLETIFDISNALGLFTFAPYWNNAPIQYRLELFDHVLDVGVWIPAQSSTKATDQVIFEVPAQSIQRQLDYPVHIVPGERLDLGDNLILELSAESPTPWTGIVRRDLDWPPCFVFGRVVDGMISIADGEQSQYLSLAVLVEDEVLAAWNTPSDQLQLIAYSEKFADDREALDGINVLQPWIYHHGWYHAANPPRDYLPKPVQPTLDRTDDTVLMSWCPEPERRYALLLPPVADGKLLTCARCSFNEQNERNINYSLYLHNLTDQGSGFFDCFWLDGPQDMERINSFPVAHPIDVGIDPVLLGDRFLLRRYDFTLVNHVDYEPVQTATPEDPSQYHIALEKGRIGEYSTFYIDGENLANIESVSWDFFCDRIEDCESLAARFLVERPENLCVTAVVREKNGIIQILSKDIPYWASQVIGFFQGAPVIQGQVEAGPIADVLAMTKNIMTNPIRNASTGCLGPAVLVRPDEQFLTYPLEGLEISLNGTLLLSEINEDSKRLALLPVLSLVEDASLSGDELLAQTNSVTLIPSQPVFIDYSYLNVSLDINKMIGHWPADDSLDTAAAMFRLDEHRKLGIEIAVPGIKFDQPAPDHNQRRLLEEFMQSKYYNIRRLTKDKQDLHWYVDLHDCQLEPGGGIVIAIRIETCGYPFDAQWELHSGAPDSACVTITNVNGERHTEYIDYSLLYQDGEDAPAYLP